MRKKVFLKGLIQKGFTLIELLVVIAVISLLASVVIASLGSTRDKGKDVAAKESMVNLRAISEIYYVDNGNSYENFCVDIEALAAMRAAASSTGLATSCDVAGDDQSWAAEVGLIRENYFCIDIKGGGRVRAISKDDIANTNPIYECPDS